MKAIRALLAASLTTLGLSMAAAPVTAAQAPIHFADLNWESGSLITEVLRFIVEKGYDLPTDTLPGTTITLETALAKNDIQVIGEEWAGRSPVWIKAQAEGKVVGLGDTVKGATEGWWVPEYVVKGDPDKGIAPLAPELRSVKDLVRYKDVFADPEAPGKAAQRIVAAQAANAVAAQRQREQGLVSAQVSDAVDGQRSGVHPPVRGQVTADVARHVLRRHQPRAPDTP